MKVPSSNQCLVSQGTVTLVSSPPLSADPSTHSSQQILLNLSQTVAPLLNTGRGEGGWGGTSSPSGNARYPDFFPTGRCCLPTPVPAPPRPGSGPPASRLPPNRLSAFSARSLPLPSSGPEGSAPPNSSNSSFCSSKTQLKCHLSEASPDPVSKSGPLAPPRLRHRVLSISFRMKMTLVVHCSLADCPSSSILPTPRKPGHSFRGAGPSVQPVLSEANDQEASCIFQHAQAPGASTCALCPEALPPLRPPPPPWLGARSSCRLSFEPSSLERQDRQGGKPRGP